MVVVVVVFVFVVFVVVVVVVAAVAVVAVVATTVVRVLVVVMVVLAPHQDYETFAERRAQGVQCLAGLCFTSGMLPARVKPAGAAFAYWCLTLDAAKPQAFCGCGFHFHVDISGPQSGRLPGRANG